MEAAEAVLPTEERVTQINRHAQKVLVSLLKEFEDKAGEETYEVEFVGELFARLIVAYYMGFYTDKIAKDSQQAAHDLMAASGVYMEETTKAEDET